jgi:ubiquinone/menaquinone biosynthesis C-methylase UbiE
LTDSTEYSARTDYLDPQEVAQYEAIRYGNLLGRYLWRREQRAIGSIVEHVGQASTVLDVPCGIGRWVPVLRRLNPELIFEADVSPAMLATSRARNIDGPPSPLSQADATALPFDDNAFDLVFCHALTKHLPISLQAQVLKELSRVSSRYVICSFSIDAGLPAVMRRLRRRHSDLSLGVSPAWLRETAAAVGLTIVMNKSCTSPVGLERSILFAHEKSD